MSISTSRGVICKDPKVILAKGRSVSMMMVNEKWFSLSLHPKHIGNIYATHVRSLVLYGSELLTLQDRKPGEAVDDELLRTFMKGILKLKSIELAKKHTKRLQLIFHIPTAEMEMDKRCLARVKSWSKRSAADKRKVA